jgi:UDPglucose 6-dehydrogenase
MIAVIVGSGYVGLVTAPCFSEVGIDVTCIDIDSNKIDNHNKRIIPIYAPELEEMVTRNMKRERLNFTTKIEEAIQDSEVLFISIGTPPDEDDSADLEYVLAVARDCGKHINDYIVVVTRNTAPVDTSQKVKKAMQYEFDKRNVKIEFDVASNPKFIKEGAAINDFLKPDRNVVGLESERPEDLMKSLYKPFTPNGHQIIFMDIISAEMTKYAANSMLVTKISLTKKITNFSEIVGAAINKVRKGIRSDSRIGHKFIYQGIEDGGSCFQKDIQVLIKTANEHNYTLHVLKAVNNHQKLVLIDKIMNYFRGNVKGRTITLWGLRFKLQTDDKRQATSLHIVKNLLEVRAIAKAYDSIAINEAKHHFGNTILYCKNQYETLINVDCLAKLTEWLEFKIPNFNIIRRLLNTPAIFDGCNIYERHKMKESGFNYFCIGIDTSKDLIKS